MELSNYLVNQILLEEKKITTVVAIYPGRFQPMGKHHAKTFQWLNSKFKDAYVATSNKVDLPKSPFSFKEKKKIINSHGIKNVVQVKNPYKAEEILKGYDPETTAAVFMVGKKDAGRLKGKFFQSWKGKAEIGYKDGAYLIIAPHVSMKVSGYGEMSGTAIRKALGDNSLEKKEKLKIFKSIFGSTKNYDLVVGKLEKLNETMADFCQNSNIINIIKEATTSQPGSNDADDGPRYFYGTQKAYKKSTSELAIRMGMEVIDYISGTEELFQHSTAFPKGPTGAVSYYPVGIPATGKKGVVGGTNYLADKKGRDAYDRWSRWSKYLAKSAGYEFLDYLGADKSISSSKKEPTKPDKKRIKMQKILAKQKKTADPDSIVLKNPEINTVAESLSQWLTDQILLTEGGAYGHMSHPFDDKGLTFGDFKSIIDLSLQGNLDLEQAATEKTDGQNLFITWTMVIIG